MFDSYLHWLTRELKCIGKDCYAITRTVNLEMELLNFSRDAEEDNTVPMMSQKAKANFFSKKIIGDR